MLRTRTYLVLLITVQQNAGGKCITSSYIRRLPRRKRGEQEAASTYSGSAYSRSLPLPGKPFAAAVQHEYTRYTRTAVAVAVAIATLVNVQHPQKKTRRRVCYVYYAQDQICPVKILEHTYQVPGIDFCIYDGS